MIAEKWVIRVNTTKFFTELKRRNVYRAAVAYGVIAWFLTHQSKKAVWKRPRQMIASNQTMKPTALPQYDSSVFATRSCRSLSLSR